MARARMVLVSMTSNDVAVAPGDSASAEVGLWFPHSKTLIVVRYPRSSAPRLEVYENVTPPSMYPVSRRAIEIDDSVLLKAREVHRRSADLLDGLRERLEPAVLAREDWEREQRYRLIRGEGAKSG